MLLRFSVGRLVSRRGGHVLDTGALELRVRHPLLPPPPVTFTCMVEVRIQPDRAFEISNARMRGSIKDILTGVHLQQPGDPKKPCRRQR
ncbi:hypothetical protein HPB50_003443 [Hyalomma asiaticum]|uniref:Uncharacterized protein n=1 Tax=Hyalomma asiaticum TaxID=266040 RepID=A0ACB7SKF2_HYAAI|nr:hypothetical protein HPB50_003443 [Hyalomma asiaticum]